MIHELIRFIVSYILLIVKEKKKMKRDPLDENNKLVLLQLQITESIASLEFLDSVSLYREPCPIDCVFS